MYHKLYERLKAEFGGQKRSPSVEAAIERRLSQMEPTKKFYPIWLNGYLCGVMEDVSGNIAASFETRPEEKP